MSPRQPADTGAEDEGQLEEARRRRIARAVGAVVALVVAVSFVVENAQPVKVRFWFFTAHPRLIYVVVACLVAGTVAGLIIGRKVRRRRAGRGGLLHRRDS
ncbi:MAG TPA: LapA family protein [Acidimicrobiales bacterium]|nr:LapA family protein [Acidimicrobiales bacterium]